MLLSLVLSREYTWAAPMILTFNSPISTRSRISASTALVIRPIRRPMPSIVSINPGFLCNNTNRSAFTSEDNSLSSMFLVCSTNTFHSPNGFDHELSTGNVKPVTQVEVERLRIFEGQVACIVQLFHDNSL